MKREQISKIAYQKLTTCLQEHLENLENFIESAGGCTWDYAAEECLYHIFSDMAVFGNSDRQIFQYLESKAYEAELQEVCSAAIRALADNWKNDQELLELLLKVAVENPFDTSTFSVGDPNLVDSPRETALKALFIRYPTHPKTLKLLQDSALKDSDEQVRWYAAQALAQLLADNSEIEDFLFSTAKNCLYDSQYNYRVSPRCTVLGAIVMYCSTHPKTFEFLQELVLNDPNEQLRLWVAEQLEQWEPSK
jgi:HEAT repeat protein